MKRMLIVMGLLIATFQLMSCGSEEGESAAGNEGSQDPKTADATPEHGVEEMVLDNGNKWEMDDHTRSMFARMAGSVQDTDFQALQGEGLKQVGTDLRGDIKELIEGCTMKGDAHGQLHLFLNGYVPAVAALAESGRIEDADKVRHYLEEYDEYFE